MEFFPPPSEWHVHQTVSVVGGPNHIEVAFGGSLFNPDVVRTMPVASESPINFVLEGSIAGKACKFIEVNWFSKPPSMFGSVRTQLTLYLYLQGRWVLLQDLSE